MTDEQNSGGTAPVDGADDKPQEGTPATPADADGSTLSTEDARKLRSEAKNLRDRLKDAETKLAERETADLTEAQKRERELAAEKATTSQLQAETRQLRAQILAGKAGVAADRVEDAVKLLDWDQIDDPSDTKQVTSALKELVKEKPWLSGRPAGLDGGNGRTGAPEGDINQMIRRAAGR